MLKVEVNPNWIKRSLQEPGFSSFTATTCQHAFDPAAATGLDWDKYPNSDH